jgi:hypothetical protein
MRGVAVHAARQGRGGETRTQRIQSKKPMVSNCPQDPLDRFRREKNIPVPSVLSEKRKRGRCARSPSSGICKKEVAFHRGE